MKASDFLIQFEASRYVRVRKRGKHAVRVIGTLSDQDKLLLGVHRREVEAVVHHRGDPELNAALKHDELRAAGLFQMDNGEWTSPYGDAEAAKILTGLITFEDAKATHARAELKAERMPRQAEAYVIWKR